MQSGAQGPATVHTEHARTPPILSLLPNLDPCSAALHLWCARSTSARTLAATAATAAVAAVALSSFGFCHLHPGATFDHFRQYQRGFHLTICRCSCYRLHCRTSLRPLLGTQRPCDSLDSLQVTQSGLWQLLSVVFWLLSLPVSHSLPLSLSISLFLCCTFSLFLPLWLYLTLAFSLLVVRLLCEQIAIWSASVDWLTMRL